MKLLKNLKIGKKLLISFILVTAISSLAAIYGVTQLITADTSYSNALVYYGFSQGDVGNFLASTNEGFSLLKDVVTADAQSVKQAQQKLEANAEEVNEYLTAVKASISDVPEEQALYKTMEDMLPVYREKRDQVIQLALSQKDAEAWELLNGETAEAYGKIQTAVQDLLILYENTGRQLSEDLTVQSRLSLILMVAGIAIGIAISIAIAIIVARSISKPMAACSERLMKLSNGDLHSPVPKIDNRDETGVLADATGLLVQKLNGVLGDLTSILGEMSRGNLNVGSTAVYEGDFLALQESTNQIVAALNDTLGQINRSADQVSSGGDQVSSGAQALSQGATEQASSVQELAATINEISSQVNGNAENAQKASRLADSVGKDMAASKQKMQDMIQAMQEISEGSQQIEKIIKTIEDIAFQTNILALNAAVEAARAGAAGKGFAVVADEVRNLASKSAEASKNTAELIETSLRAVENGTAIAGETADSLVHAVEGAEKVTSIVDDIARASNDQAESIAQVTMGVDQISSVVQTNSATAEESAAASEELSSQAVMLKNLVNRFKLKNGGEERLALALGQHAGQGRF